MKVFGLSTIYNSNFSINFINLNLENLLLFLEGKDLILSKLLNKYINPIICLGESLVLRGFFVNSIISLIKHISPTALILNIQQKANAESLALLNIDSATKNDINSSDLCFAVNLDSTLSVSKYISSNKNLVWLNTHGSNLALKAKKIIPLHTEFEEDKLFINLEEKIQKTNKVFSSIGNARSFTSFINIFINKNKTTLINTLLYNLNILEDASLFNSNKSIYANYTLFENKFILHKKTLCKFPIKSSVEDFYCSNKMTRYSLTMVKCSQEFRKLQNNFIN